MANQSARTIWIILLNMLGSLMWHLTTVHCWKAVCPSSIIPPSKDCWNGVPWIGWIITNQDMLATGLPTGSYMLQIGVIGGLCAVWLSRRERKGWKLKPLIEELREEQKWTKQRVFQWHVSLCAVDAAVSAVLELGFLATRESVCRNCASHGHGPTTA